MLDADAVIARTRNPAGDYSLLQWTDVRLDGGQDFSFWAAEFHRGSLHRVETPLDRIVADCAAMTGTHVSLVTGETKTGRAIAETACGVDAAGAENPEFLGRNESGYGPLDIVRFRKQGQDRTYWINSQGVIVRTEFAKVDDSRSWVLRNWAIRINASSPDAAMFAASSLERSYVPADYQVQREPEHPVAFVD